MIDLDVQKFFDSVPWDLMVKAVQANITTGQKWVLLYVRRWLAAPLQRPDGTLKERDRGTPQRALCAAAHKEPYEQRWVMHSARGLPLVEAVSTTGRCA
jgi:retron-type reverse transcriptase